MYLKRPGEQTVPRPKLQPLLAWAVQAPHRPHGGRTPGQTKAMGGGRGLSVASSRTRTTGGPQPLAHPFLRGGATYPREPRPFQLPHGGVTGVMG